MPYDEQANMKKENHEEQLRRAGFRATRQRIALLGVLEGTASPLAVEDIVRASRAAFDTATAYRMLESFREAGLVKRIDLAQGRALYESSGRHHHHALCTECGKIVDVEACLPKSLDEQVRKAAGFAQIRDHALEFFGLCTRCAKRA